ncbi:ABC transporter substrate-binding protein [Streptosporangium sp. NPDC050855]|uniref:ABC transporter substrate-binding protein n=1 Tax=Streptosporangium sp. NPDC050855 TaxID=3366194 RepID=UPI0037B7587E
MVGRRGLAVLGLGVVAALTAACGGGGGGAAGTAPASGGTGGAAGGGTLVVDTSFQLKTADPARQFEPTAQTVLYPVYETLVTYKGADVKTAVPGVAELPEIDESFKKFTFTLRDGVKFSDGTPMTAKDVVYTFERIAGLKGNPSFLLDGVKTEAPDDKTVVLTTEKPDSALMAKLSNPALGIENSAAVEKMGGTKDAESDKAEPEFAKASYGSGPYKITKFDAASEVVLERNDGYWGTKPVYSKIVVRNVQANVQQLNLTQGGSQLALDLRPDQATSLGENVTVNKTAAADIAFLLVNDDPAVSSTTSNKDFQEAVRYGVDYAGLLNLVGEGAVQPGGVVPSMFSGALAPADAVKRDVARAKAALARSGISSPSVKLNYASDLTYKGVGMADIAARLQQNLKEVGIDVQLDGKPVTTALDSYRAGKDELSLQWWGPDYNHPNDYLLFTPGQMVGLRAGWKEDAAPEITKLAEKAETADDATRDADFQALQKAMNAEGPFIPLFQPSAVVAGAKQLGPLDYNPLWTVDLTTLR